MTRARIHMAGTVDDLRVSVRGAGLPDQLHLTLDLIGTPKALRALVKAMLDDPDDEEPPA